MTWLAREPGDDMILAPAQSHRHDFSDWRTTKTEPGPFGKDTISVRECGCGQMEKRTIEHGPFGEEVRIDTVAVAKPQQPKVVVQEKIVRERLSAPEMIQELKTLGYTHEDNVIFSPLQAPEGQMLVDEKIWHQQYDRSQKLDQVEHMMRDIRMLAIVGWVCTLVEAIFLLGGHH